MRNLKNKLSQLFRHAASRNPQEGRTNKPSTLSDGAKRGLRIYAAIVLALTFLLSSGMTAFAASDPIQVVNNLSDFVFGLIRAIGLILLGFGIVQIGLSLKGHDPSQRANGFMTFAGGIVIFFAREILTLITGG
jgi:hypothetical protein